MQVARKETADAFAPSAKPARAARKPRRSAPYGGGKPSLRTWLTILLFLGPNLVGFLVFIVFPVALSLVMAFTNWSIKPAIHLQFVGLRNFADMLGVVSLAPAPAWLAPAYFLAIIVCIAGLAGTLGAGFWKWSGRRWGGIALSLLGLGIAGISALRYPSQGLIITGALLFLSGASMTLREDADWRLGPAVFPPILLAVAASVLWMLHRPMWAGFDLRDTRFYYYFYNTLYLMIGIPFTIAGSMALALLLTDSLPISSKRQRLIGFLMCAACGLFTLWLVWRLGQPNLAVIAFLFWLLAGLGFLFDVIAYRTVFYLPSFTSGVALMILWKALYNPETGPINSVLESICSYCGIAFEKPNWLASVALAKPALIVMGFWIGIGGMNMLLYLAALSNIPGDLIDASKVDGASPWNRLRYVIWPQLAPTTFFITVVSIIGGMQGGFEQARVMTYGGPAGSTTTLSYYIYTKAFLELDLGYAAAISWILFAIIFVATLFHWKTGKNIDVE